jgi:hypothetical protein
MSLGACTGRDMEFFTGSVTCAFIALDTRRIGTLDSFHAHESARRVRAMARTSPQMLPKRAARVTQRSASAPGSFLPMIFSRTTFDRAMGLTLHLGAQCTIRCIGVRGEPASKHRARSQ